MVSDQRLWELLAAEVESAEPVLAPEIKQRAASLMEATRDAFDEVSRSRVEAIVLTAVRARGDRRIDDYSATIARVNFLTWLGFILLLPGAGWGGRGRVRRGASWTS